MQLNAWKHSYNLLLSVEWDDSHSLVVFWWNKLSQVNTSTMEKMWLIIVCCCSGRKVLEVRTMTDEERIQQLENELEVTILFGEEADRKYEEV